MHVISEVTSSLIAVCKWRCDGVAIQKNISSIMRRIQQWAVWRLIVIFISYVALKLVSNKIYNNTFGKINALRNSILSTKQTKSEAEKLYEKKQLNEVRKKISKLRPTAISKSSKIFVWLTLHPTTIDGKIEIILKEIPLSKCFISKASPKL